MPTPERTNLAPAWALPAFLVAIVSLGTIGYVMTRDDAPENQQAVVTQQTRVARPGDTDSNDEFRNDDLLNTTVPDTPLFVEQEAEPVAQNAQPVTTPAVTTIIVDASVYGDATDKMSLLGKRMTLQNVVVNTVPGDHVFSVRSGNTDFFAALDPQLDTRGGMEQIIRVKPGDVRTLVGEFKSSRNTTISAPDIRSQLTTAQVYFHVTGISEPVAESETLE